MLRVVIDTSSLVSYILTAGNIMKQVVYAWEARDFVFLTSPATRSELIAVLERPYIQQRAHISPATLMEGIVKYTEWIAGNLNVPPVCRDPKDDKFLACAVEGKAHYIVSSDKDLLEMKVFEGICILNPGQFLVILQLSRMDTVKIKTTYSSETLHRIQQNLCLDSETKKKVELALA